MRNPHKNDENLSTPVESFWFIVPRGRLECTYNQVIIYAFDPFSPMIQTHRLIKLDNYRALQEWANKIKSLYNIETDTRKLVKLAYPITQLQGLTEQDLGVCYDFWRSSTLKKLSDSLTALPTIRETCHKAGIHAVNPYLVSLEATYNEWRKTLLSERKARAGKYDVKFRTRHLFDILAHLDEKPTLNDSMIKATIEMLFEALGRAPDSAHNLATNIFRRFQTLQA